MSNFSLVSPFLYYPPICLLRGHFLYSCYVLGTVWFWEWGSCPAFKQKQGSANISRNWWLRSACRRVLGTIIIARVACSTSHCHERPDRETRVAGVWGVRGFENLCCVCQFVQVCMTFVIPGHWDLSSHTFQEGPVQHTLQVTLPPMSSLFAPGTWEFHFILFPFFFK